MFESNSNWEGRGGGKGPPTDDAAGGGAVVGVTRGKGRQRAARNPKKRNGVKKKKKKVGEWYIKTELHISKSRREQQKKPTNRKGQEKEASTRVGTNGFNER